MSTHIPVEKITVPKRLRPVDESWAAALAAFFEDGGQETPIIVRPMGDGFELVAGAHRLAAAKALEWTEIKAEVEELSDLQAQLAEIDENVMRRELGPLDRAIFLAKRKQVYLALYPETAYGGDGKSKKSKSQSLRLGVLPRRFSAETADKIGLSERAVQLSLAIAEGLDAGLLDALRASPIVDNQAALQALAAMDRRDQRKVVAMFRERGCTTLLAAKQHAGLVEEREIDPAAEQMAKAKAWFAAWDRRSQAAFLAECQALHRKGVA